MSCDVALYTVIIDLVKISDNRIDCIQKTVSNNHVFAFIRPEQEKKNVLLVRYISFLK